MPRSRVTGEFCKLVREVREMQMAYFEVRTGQYHLRLSPKAERLLDKCKNYEADLDGWIEVYRDEVKTIYRVDHDENIELPDFEEDDFVGMVEQMRIFQRTAFARSKNSLFRKAKSEERKIDKWLERNALDRQRWFAMTGQALP